MSDINLTLSLLVCELKDVNSLKGSSKDEGLIG